MDKLWTENEYDVSMLCVKRQLDRFAYVDNVFPYQVVTTPCKVFDRDLMTCTVADLEFASKYQLTPLNKEELGYQVFDNFGMNGLIIWFDVDFPAGVAEGTPTQLSGQPKREVLTLSTSPYEDSTHWKQQLLYFQGAESSVMLSEETQVKGSFALRKNPKDERDIQLKVSVKIDEADFNDVFYYIFT